MTDIDFLEKAPAKINLGLKVISRRSDGYHDILSIFQTISLYDELCISPSGTPGITCNNPDVPTDNSNLLLKAQQRIATNFPKAHFSLKKNIPLGAGLGGGSADAAAALRILNRVHRLGLNEHELHNHAAVLGSDVPFMLYGGTSVVNGRGEVMTDAPWPFEFTYIVVYPGIAVSTAWAYRSLRNVGNDCSVYKAMTEDLLNGTLDVDGFFSSLANDFEPSVFEEYPVLKKLKYDMVTHGADASIMTGSGSSIVGIFTDNGIARECAEFFRQTDFSVYITKTVPKRHYHKLER